MDSRLAQIENLTLSGFLNYSPGDKRVDEKRGEKDGQRDKPEPTAQNYPFRKTVVTEAQAALQAYQDKADGLIAQLEKREASLQRDIDERYAVQRSTIKAKRDAEVNEAERRWGPNSARHASLQERFDKSSDQERYIEAQLGRPLRIHLYIWYSIIMACVALVEIPINRFAFELYFSETPIISLLIAAGIGVALMFLAHFGGMWIKRSVGAPTTSARVLYILGVLFASLLVFPTIYLIALLRQHYVNFIAAQNVSFGELLRQKGLGTVARDVLTTELGTQGLMLLMINLLVVGIGVLVSVARHDSHPDFERVVFARQRLDRRLVRLKRKYERVLAGINKRYDALFATLDKQQDRIEKELEDLRGQRIKCVGHKGRVVERVALHVKLRLHAYEAANEAVRESPPPKGFWQATEAEIKRELEKSFVERPSPPASPADIRAVT